MKRIWLFFILGIFLAGCTYQVRDYPVIKDPAYQKVVVKEKERVVVKEKEKPVVVDLRKEPEEKKEDLPEVVTYYPDPTQGWIKNKTYNVHIEVWLSPEKGKLKGLPDFNLPPKVAVPATMPLGKHLVYGKGRIKTKEYGWQSVGVVSKEVSIDSRVYYGGDYGWEMIFDQGDFLLR